MPILHQTIATKPSPHAAQGFDATYTGYVDKSWAIGAIPQGGYLLALIIDATTKFQSLTRNTAPIYVTAHYLNSGVLNCPFQINLRLLKVGSLFTNVSADFIQQGTLRITSHLIFGQLGAPAPATPYTRRLPHHRHPSTAPLRVDDHWLHKGTNKSSFLVSSEPEIALLNEPDATRRADDSTYGRGGLFWGGWYTLTNKDDLITPPMYAIFCDILLGRADHSTEGSPFANWYPTVTISIEFKSPLPATSAKRTVGSYTSGSFFLSHPNKRHNTVTELWSAPSDLGEGHDTGTTDWREKQVCLAVASQMALIVPIEVNHRKDRGRGRGREQGDAKL